MSAFLLPLIAATVIGPKDLAIIGMAAMCAAALVAWLYRKDTAIEQRRKHAIELASLLKSYDLDRLGGIVTNYAVGDYSGLVHEIELLLKEISNPEQAFALLGKSFFKQLPHRLETAGEKEKIIAAVSPYLPEAAFAGDEDRKRQAIELAGLLKKFELDRLAEIVTSFAVGDHVQTMVEVKSLLREISDPEQAMALLKKSFFKQLPHRLETAGDREQIVEAVMPYVPDPPPAAAGA